MVLPLVGAALGAGGSIYGSILGAQASEDAANMNWAINLYNNRQRNKEREESKRYAEELRAEGKLGGRDALGNRTYFKEGEGWVTDLAPQQQALLDYFYQNELPQRRDQFNRRAANSREANDIAGSLFDEFRRINRDDPADTERMLYARASEGIGDAQRDNMETAMRSALQTGSSNAGSVAASISREGVEAGRRAAMDAALQAPDYVENRYNSRRGQVGNLLNMFLSQANGDIGASYDTSNVGDDANSLMARMSAGDDAANSMGFQAANKQGGSLDYVEPRNGAANAAITIGNSLGALGNRFGSYGDQQRNNRLFEQFLTQGGQSNFGQGGIFGAMTDRVKPNSGWF